MRFVPLSGEETKIIFSDKAISDLGSLDGPDQKAILRKLLQIVEQPAFPSSYVREKIKNIDIIAVGNSCRLYTKVVERIPRSNKLYHVIWVLYIDRKHEYRPEKLTEYNFRAYGTAEQLKLIGSVPEIEEYFVKYKAFGRKELQDLLLRHET